MPTATPISDYGHSNGTIGENVRCDRKWKIQDGDRLTSKMYISACTQDINEIPTAIPMFSGSNCQMRIEGNIVLEETGSGISKMAAINLKILISQLIDKTGTRFQLLNLCFRGPAIQRQSKLRYKYFQFNGRHLEFSVSGSMENFLSSSVGLLNPVNIEAEIVFLSCLKAEI